MSQSIDEKREAIRETLEILPDNEERLLYFLDEGKRYPALDSSLLTEERLLPGCLSQLWIAPEYRDGKCFFGMHADALTTKGIAAVVCNLYNGETPETIVAQELDFLTDAGIYQVISTNRRNGLSNLRGRIKAFAVACVAGTETDFLGVVI